MEMNVVYLEFIGLSNYFIFYIRINISKVTASEGKNSRWYSILQFIRVYRLESTEEKGNTEAINNIHNNTPHYLIVKDNNHLRWLPTVLNRVRPKYENGTNFKIPASPQKR